MPKKFEDKVKELESLIAELENGNSDLDDSIQKYTTAMKLIKECDDELKQKEELISKIIKENGEEENFEPEQV